VYGTIASSVYNGSSLTTVTIGGGEGPLDSGLSSVAYGFLAAQNPSLPSVPIAGSAVKRLVALNNTVTPVTKMDMSATAITFIQPATGGTYTKLNQGVVTNDIGLTGPAANGRDQAAAFGSAANVHFYFIWNGATVATLSSLAAPSVGPTLPTGYTHWAYALSVVLGGASSMPSIHAFGMRVFYDNPSSLGNTNVSVSATYAQFVPLIAESFSWRGSFNFGADGSGNAYGSLGIDSGLTNQIAIYIGRAGVTGSQQDNAKISDLPNMPGQIFTWVISVTSGVAPFGTTNFVTDYVVPNY